jgi:long-chain-acyl-CoA dehydrogenase
LLQRRSVASVTAARPEPSMAAMLTDTNTRRIFTSDHDLVRDTARKFFLNDVVPFHDA